MIVWGGYSDGGPTNTGGKYTPSSDTWTPTSTNNAPDQRERHTAVWTGSEMIVWGGYRYPGPINTGGRYTPSTNTWTATSTNNPPEGRDDHTAVWTGSEMIVWGGYSNGGLTNTGGRYSPSTDTWTATSTNNAPQGRVDHTAVWTGGEMIVWGGRPAFPPIGVQVTNTGGRYIPRNDTWTVTSTTNAPEARYLHTAIWTGSDMIVWGGSGSSYILNTGGRYCAQTPTPALELTSAVSQKMHGDLGPFDVLLPLSGEPGIECRNSGGNHKIVITFVNDVVSGDVSLTTQKGGAIAGTSFAANTMTIDLTGVADQQTITVTLADVTDIYDQVLPETEVRMSVLIGDTSGNGTVNGTDVSQTKFQSGHAVTEANFREDVVVSGSINSTDVSQVKSRSENGLSAVAQRSSRSVKTRGK